MLKLQVDSLVLRDFTNILAVPYSVQKADGFEAPDYRVGSYEKPGEDGARVTAAFYGGRPFTIQGDMQTADVATFQAARQALNYAFRTQRDQYNYPLLTRILVTANDGSTYFLDAQVKTFKNPLSYPTYSSFISTLYAPDPAIYGTSQVTTGQIARLAAGGVTFPLTFPVIFTAGSGGVGFLNNAGNLDTWPVMTIRGAVTNPLIYAVERGGLIQLGFTTTNATDVIVIDMKNRTVMLNGTTSLLTYLTTDSRWFSLPPDANTIEFNTGSAGDTGTVEVTAYSAFLGL